MLGSLLAGIGSSIGKYFGGGILSTIGRYGGRFLGDYLDNKWLGRKETIHQFKNVKDSFTISTAKYGSPIPLVFGKMRVPGQIIWTDRIAENSNTTSTSSYFKSQHLTLEKQTSELEYFATFAVAICEGEILDINRVWHDEDLINLNQYKFRLYKGDEEQLPDPLMVASCIDIQPAYRGLAYIVFENLPLADFNDNIPQFTFEVTRKSNINHSPLVEDLVTSMVMIPGTGEYVYDTIVQEKSVIATFGAVIDNRKINCHNHYNIANSLYSLNQLQATCANIKWISPVVCWFGNSLNISDCIIRPAVEFKEPNIVFSEEWIVGKYNRQNAYEITKDEFRNPIYGGSVNDASLIRYLMELQRRQLKVMFNPMFFLDVPGKPWRGKLSGDARVVENFFKQEHGYNDFILHYANLVKNHVDAFIIGSELIGLTSIKVGDNYPAVDELIKLAQKVKQIVGANVLVSYAADWSEYHHTEGGWYNLDPLWASDAIDFVGIDAYFPVTDTSSSKITIEEIISGMSSGEGYDYYYSNDRNVKHDLGPEYAWKNIKYWWENTHQNPDGRDTPWCPRSKPIWFTEFGFPSIDKATNQPNLFYDHNCVDSGIPRHSSGNVDFSIQRKAISAFIKYWSSEEYIGQMFLWTWDARPYPAWPHMDIWRDGYLWERGHWVNNKFGSCNIAAIILELSKKCSININNVNVDSVDMPIEGLLLSNQITAIETINTLRTSYFFDINAHDQNIISFVSRSAENEVIVDSSEMLKLSDNSYIEITEIPKNVILGKIDLYFINQNDNYNTAYCYINNESNSYANKATIRLPQVMSLVEASRLGEMLLSNAHTEDRIIKFALNSFSLRLKPSNFVIFNYQNKQYFIRVINVVLKNMQLSVTGIVDNLNSYSKITFAKNKLDIQYSQPRDVVLTILDLPIHLNGRKTTALIAYLQSQTSIPLYAKLSNDVAANWERICNLSPSNSIGTLVELAQLALPNIFHIDEISYFTISAIDLDISASGKWNYALVGQEIISFKYIEKIQIGLYRISHLVRGIAATEKHFNRHIPNERVILLNSGANIIPVSENMQNHSIDFKCGDCEITVIYENKAAKPLAPLIINQELNDIYLQLNWLHRSLDDGNWQYNPNHNPVEFTVTIADHNSEIIQKTDLCELLIDISSLDISGGYKIDIVPRYR